MQATNESNKNERGIWGGGGFEFGLTECAFLPQDCDISITLLKVILGQHQCIIMATTLEKIYSCIGWSHKNLSAYVNFPQHICHRDVIY